MSPRTSLQNEKIRQDRKAIIMETALSLFANDGYHQTSINKIATTAGISKGLMYNYFDSKEALLMEILHKSTESYLLYFDPDKDGVLTTEEFTFYITQTFDVIDQNLDFWRLLFRIMLQPNVSALLKTRSYHLSKYLIKLLKDYFELHGYENSHKEVVIFMALVQGGIIQHAMGSNDAPTVLRDYLIERYVTNIK